MLNEEFDTSDLAWNIYYIMYDLTGCVKNDDARKAVKGIINYDGITTQDELVYSGDTDFNFGAGWSHSIFDKYKKYIGEISFGNDEEREQFIKQYTTNLKVCQDVYKSIVNISLIPKTGNLQMTKKGLGNDRLDVYIWALDRYYDENEHVNLLVNNSTGNHMELLYQYLNQFSDVYEYCKAVYHINESLVDDMIESGKKGIDSPERVIEYMYLALRFWRQKLMYLKSCDLPEETKSEILIISSKLDKVF